jgi:hypothetical protein
MASVPFKADLPFTKEISMFFDGTDAVHQTMEHLVEALERAQIPYALVGGMAVFAHRYHRTTDDVDILLTPEGFTAFRQRFVPGTFQPVSRRPRRFRDPANGVTFDVLVTGLFPGTGQPGPIAYPHPADVSEVIANKRVVNLATLVQLKLAARRHQDFADVVNLIRFNGLDESYLTRLHPSVHGDFIQCLEEKRREVEYEARQDQAFAEEFPTEGDEDSGG